MTRFAVQWHDLLTSTMDAARAAARAGAPDGTVVAARRQTTARGRQGRAWTSPAGNLHVSILVRTGLPTARLTELGFVAALAVADTVDAVLPRRRARLKWPNDVLVDGAKIAGILVELEDDTAVVGVGVNVVAAPDGLPYPATCVFACGGTADAEAVLARLLDALAGWLGTWRRDGFAAVRTAWLGRGPAVGEPVRIRRGQEIDTGTFAGLDADGALLVADARGTRRVVAGDVTPGG